MSEVVVVGAGPYGLATAAHLREAGVDVHVFGEPMETWQRHMPAGMVLRSHRRASHIAHPNNEFGLDRFLANRNGFEDPLPLEVFVEYGLWFQRHAVPGLDNRRVTSVSVADSGFELALNDGERLHARRVVVAAGTVPFAWRPPELESLPARFVSHTSEHADLAPIARGRVIVVGAGQSALESAALLAEAGASVELVARRPEIKWLVETGPRNRRPVRNYAYNRIGVGGTRSSWLIANPAIWSRLPRDWRIDVAYRSVGPAGASWLRPRLADVPITLGTRVLTAVETNGKATLRLDDGSERTADHVLLATGYRVDVSRYEFLTPELRREIATRDGAPLLLRGLESLSVPGLHIVGAPATDSFGPINRFVAGTWASARSVTRVIAQARTRPGGFSW